MSLSSQLKEDQRPGWPGHKHESLFEKISKGKMAVGVAEVVEQLLSKLKTPNSNPSK
jgi:hypothetical protein